MRRASKENRWRFFVLWVISWIALIGSPVSLRSNPHEPEVVHGTVEFGDEIDGRLEILQRSDRAVIEWDYFSIGSDEVTRFIQPGSGSAALNRVRGGSGSVIDGLLEANGQIFLLNPNGVIIGANGRVDAAGFVASTLELNDQVFLEGGELHFQGGSQAAVVNLGQIGAFDGDVFLVGKTVANQGVIQAPKGTVGLAAGSDVLIKASGKERVFVRGAAGAKNAIGVDNTGVIESSVAELKAHGGNVYALAIRNEGRVAANGVENVGGEIFLRANGGRIQTGAASVLKAAEIEIDAGTGPDAKVVIGGRINADRDTDGGAVTISGTEVEFQTGAAVSAKGAENGGSVRIGGVIPVERVTIAEGAGIRADGDAGAGGLIAIAGSESSVISIAGTLSARSATQNGGSISVGGGDLTIAETGWLKVGGEVNGGLINLSAQRQATIEGRLNLRGKTGDGGAISLAVEDGLTVTETAVLDASGKVDGGTISVSAGDEADLVIAGQLLARGEDGVGGSITIEGAEDISVEATGLLDASGGSAGGFITISSEGNVDIQGQALAFGVDGDGGSITIEGAEGVIVGSGAMLDASGDGNGGVILVDGGSGTTEFAGTARAAGENGSGGTITMMGDTINVAETAVLEASGLTGGGNIFVGGGARGEDPEIRNSENVTIAPGAVLSTDAVQSGDGGNVVAFANGSLDFRGQISANGGSVGGNGGFAEVSGKESLILAGLTGHIDLSAAAGLSGTLLIDPIDVTVTTAVGAAIGGSPVNQNTLIDSDISAFLENFNLEIQTNGAGGNGDITLLTGTNISWNSENALTFTADRTFTMNGTAQINANVDGSVVINAAQNAVFNSGSSVSVADGSITVNANPGTPSVGSFHGISLTNADLTVTGFDGGIDLNGTGGGSGFSGIHLEAGSTISSTGSNSGDPPAGFIDLNGSGGTGVDSNRGIAILDSKIESVEGNVSLDGTGTGTGSNNTGVFLSGASAILAKDASVFITGVGSTAGVDGNHGIELVGAAQLRSDSFDLTVNATAGLTGSAIAGSGATRLSALNGTLAVNFDGDITHGGIRYTGGTVNFTGQDTGETIRLFAIPTFSAGFSFDGGGATDTLDFSSATGAINLDLATLTSIENLIGSSRSDSILGTDGGEEFAITTNNGGNIGSGAITFSSIERLLGGTGDDSFSFSNQATLSVGVDGGADTNGDTISIDDTNLTTDETYTIRASSINRNPTYNFSNIEALELFAGSGNDTVNSRFLLPGQTLDGGLGTNTLNVVGASLPASVPNGFLIPPAGGPNVNYFNFGEVTAIPDPVDPGTPGGGGRNGIPPIGIEQLLTFLDPGVFEFDPEIPPFFLPSDDVGRILQIEVSESGIRGDDDGSDGTIEVVDNFTRLDAGVVFAAGGSPAFVAQATGGQIGDQVVVGEAGARPRLLSFNGGSRPEPDSLEALLENISPAAESELNRALGGDGTAIVIVIDGTVPINAAGGVALIRAILEVLAEHLSIAAAAELSAAFNGEGVGVSQRTGVAPTNGDGPPASPPTLAILLANLTPQAFSELSAASGGDGSAEVGPAAVIAFQLNGATAGLPITLIALSANLSNGALLELGRALGGAGKSTSEPGGGLAILNPDGAPPTAAGLAAMREGIGVQAEIELSAASGAPAEGTADESDGPEGITPGVIPNAAQQQLLADQLTDAARAELANSLQNP
ncbi:MAG: filamentous hemagglutinin family protein [Verrucomicrobiales bacterium]|jgi:filamentous hemagglutinin family protein